MSTVTVPNPVQTLLADLRERVEVRDEAGNLLGFFTPRQVEEELLYQRAEREIDEEEIERISASNSPSYTIEEVQAHLRSLEVRE